MSSLPEFRVDKNGTNQSLATTELTQVTFSTERFDVGSYFASNAWTPPAGLICLCAIVDLGGAMSTNANGGIGIYKNGVALIKGEQKIYSGFGRFNVITYDQANGTDAYTVWAYNQATSSRVVSGGVDLTNFSGYWIQ